MKMTLLADTLTSRATSVCSHSYDGLIGMKPSWISVAHAGEVEHQNPCPGYTGFALDKGFGLLVMSASLRQDRAGCTAVC